MTGEFLQTILKTAQSKADKEGFSTLPDGASLTLYLAHDGVGLTVNRVEAVRIQGNGVEARVHSSKREVFMLELGDVFAVTLEGSIGSPPKRAGFG